MDAPEPRKHKVRSASMVEDSEGEGGDALVELDAQVVENRACSSG